MKNIRKIVLAAAAAASLFSSAAFAQTSSGDGIEGPAAPAIKALIKKERLNVTEATVFYGDLSGQGTKDALAVVYSAIPGGNAESIDVWVLRDRKGTYAVDRSAKTDKIFGQEPRDARFEPGKVSVTLTTLGPNDPRCCPTTPKTYTIPVK